MIQKKIRVYEKVLAKIIKAQKIAFISHKNPDLDTIWTATWFYEVIKENFPEKKLSLYCIDDIPEKYKFIKHTELYKYNFNPTDYHLIIFLDSWSSDQTWYDCIFPELYDKNTYNTISIDHHISNTIYAKQNILNTKYASTSMIVFEMLYINNLVISKDACTCFLAWIIYDTGWFKHSNVDRVCFLITSKLIKLWAEKDFIVDKFYNTNKLSKIKLWWKILKDSFIDNNWVMNSYVNKTTIDSFWTNYDDINGVVDYLNMAENIKYTKLLTQKWDYVKWSLRTLRDDVDLVSIAKKYNGAWHKKASWFTIKSTVESIKTLNLITT